MLVQYPTLPDRQFSIVQLAKVLGFEPQILVFGDANRIWPADEVEGSVLLRLVLYKHLGKLWVL